MTKIKVLEKPRLSKPLLLVGLPGVGNIGRVAVGYLVSELKAKKFAELHSKWFFPFVVLHDKSVASLLKNELYYYKGKKAGERDMIFLVGDCQSLSPQGHYEVIDVIMDFAEKLGVKEIITVGGLATGELDSAKGLIGAVSDEKVMKKYRKYKIDFNAGEKVGYIVGAAGLMLGIGKERGIEGLCLLGQTSGFPIVTDPKAAESALDVLVKMFGLKIDMGKLEKKVDEMEKFIKKVEGLQMKAVSELAKASKAPSSGEQLRYIG
ncbi:MAG: proteasome assembly chaperone family protein [Candidatus Aenigmatarchaeota archaeon]|nr:MAG: proteasome assembly chaperone family protein [Candidatus Aenigmarchaeota archaeon]